MGPCGKAGEVLLTVECDKLAKAVSCCIVMPGEAARFVGSVNLPPIMIVE